MTDRDSVSKAMTAFERSLREGPVDEAGYRAEAIDYGADALAEPRRRLGGTRGSVGLARRPGGLSPVLTYIGSAAILLVTIFGGLAVLRTGSQAGSSPSPLQSSPASASPIPIPVLSETFVSTRNGFSVRYPAGWSTKAATGTWRPSTYLTIGNPALDELELRGVARLVVASQRLAAGQTEAAWLASFVQPFDLGFCTGDRASWPRVSVDGRLGYLDVEACPAAADTRFSTPDLRFDVLVFSGGRVYEITLNGIVDRAYFEAILATIRLDPAAALDPPEAT